ncbi:MAG: hypothetical protein JW938_05990, partial [Candidatus Omnitrophica bacterium]|nr:hypothetical protein [Candidatus Omnitrophota bacterium]
MVYRRTFLFISFILISILFATSQADAAYKIQQGRVQVTSNQQDIPITAVSSMSKAFVIIDRGTGWRDGNCDADDTCVRGMLQAVDNIRVYRTSSSNSSWISYQVIECTKDEFTVYRNSGSFAAGSGDTSASIGATVTPSNCFAWVTADNNQGNQTHFAGSELTAYVDSSTTVRIQRAYTTTAAVNYNWVVVEFDPDRIASIQTGESLVTTHNESSRYNQSISEVDLDTSMLFLQHRTDANGITHAAIAGTFNSATQISFYKYTTYSSNSSVRWYVIDFGGDADAQRNQIDNSSDSGWYTEDVTLSPTVVLANTIVFHSMGCNGTATGTAYPRPYATNLLTSTSNLRIERIRQGQQTYNEWQVLQMPTCSYIDIDGTVYTNEAKSANVGANKTIALSVNGDAVQTAETDSNGSFSFTDVQVYPDDVLLLYIDDETENGSFVTITDSLTDFTGASEIDMYTDKVVLHHQTGTEITNTELDVIDGVDAGDEDGITITGSDVEFASGFEVWVESGATYTPGGDVEADSFEVAGTGTFAPGANFITIHGNWTVSATGVFTISGGATFDGSGTQVITTGGTDASHDFEDLTHSGSGTFQLAASSDLDVNESLTKSGSGDIDTQGRAVTAKWLFMEAGTFNTSGDAGSWNINGDVELNGGTLTATSGNFNIQGDFLNSAAFVHNSGTLIFDATSGSV